MKELTDRFLDIEQALQLIDPQSALYLLVMLIILYIGKKLYDLCTPYDLNEQLTKEDNKAVALAFGGYFLGLGIILSGVLSGESAVTPTDNAKRDLFADLLNTAIWSIIGIILLQAARIINDKVLLNRFDNIKELVTDRNVGTGAVECGSLVGSAFIVKASLTGDEVVSFQIALALALIYFIAGQIAFVVFGKLYQRICRYDLHKEVENDNVAAGLSFGLSLTAVGILLSGYIIKFESLPGLMVWFVIGAFSLLACRYIVDKLILPGDLLDEEISKDRNWGAALVEGTAAIGVALFCISML